MKDYEGDEVRFMTFILAATHVWASPVPSVHSASQVTELPKTPLLLSQSLPIYMTAKRANDSPVRTAVRN